MPEGVIEPPKGFIPESFGIPSPLVRGILIRLALNGHPLATDSFLNGVPYTGYQKWYHLQRIRVQPGQPRWSLHLRNIQLPRIKAL